MQKPASSLVWSPPTDTDTTWKTAEEDSEAMSGSVGAYCDQLVMSAMGTGVGEAVRVPGICRL